MSRLSKVLILYGIRKWSGTEEAELHIFGSQCKADVRKRNFTSWGMITERESGSGERKQNFSYLAVMTGRKCGSRDEMRKCTFTSLEVLVEQVQKRNLRFFEVFSRQNGSAEAKLQTFRSPGRAEVRKLNFGKAEVRNGPHVTSWVVNRGRKCGSGT